MGLFSKVKEILSDRKHNQELYKSGKANKNEVHLTTIGWKSNSNQIETDASKSPSGNTEYHTIKK